MDVDAEAESILRSQVYPVDRPTNPEHLACALLGAGRVVTVPGIYGTRVAARMTREGVLELSSRASPESRRWLCAHELAEWWLRRHGYEADDVEQIADRLAAALVVPRPAFREALRWSGRNLAELAAVFCTTQSIVTLRLGEVTGSPLALVTPRAVMVRGEEWGWPGARELRRLADAPELPRELERLRVTDAPRRVALVAVAA